MRNRLLLVLSIAVFAATPAAQQPAPAQPPAAAPAQQPPLTFKVEVNYVEVDARVTDEAGNFVQGLTRDDFEILEAGRPQTISIFAPVNIPVERTDPPLFAKAPIEPDVRTNQREFDGRVFVLVMDDLHTDVHRTPRLRIAAKQFVERYLGANDVAAVVSTGGAKGTAQDFTTSRRRLVEAIDRISGQKLRSSTLERMGQIGRQIPGQQGGPRDQLESERAYKARNTLSTLKNTADFLAGIRGRRKAVVFFSEGIDYDVTNPIQHQWASDILAETRTAIQAATRANVSFYGVDPRGLGGFEDLIDMPAPPEDNSLGMHTLQNELRLAQDSLRVLSDETGGFAAVNMNDYREAFDRIIRENSSYYVLGYYSTDERRDGRFRSIEVRVKRPGLQVRARKGYTAPKGRPASPSTAASAGTSAELREALDSPIPISGLGLTAFAAPFRGSGNKARISIALEVDGSRFKFAEKDGKLSDTIEVSLIAFDDSGKVRDGGRDTVTLTPRPQTRDSILRTGVRMMRRLELAPGKYQLRIAAREEGSGAVGSVMLDLDVPDFSKGDLSMSALAVTSPSASAVPTAAADEQFKDVLPAAPTARREFARGEELALFTEIYDNQTRTPHRVQIKTTVLGDTGTAVFASTDERRSEELGAAGGGYGHTAKVPLNFPPGRYVLRVEAQTLLANGATAMRELEFRVR
jgi:VWFA-related protein